MHPSLVSLKSILPPDRVTFIASSLKIYYPFLHHSSLPPHKIVAPIKKQIAINIARLVPPRTITQFSSIRIYLACFCPGVRYVLSIKHMFGSLIFTLPACPLNPPSGGSMLLFPHMRRFKRRIDNRCYPVQNCLNIFRSLIPAVIIMKVHCNIATFHNLYNLALCHCYPPFLGELYALLVVLVSSFVALLSNLVLPHLIPPPRIPLLRLL